MQTWVVVALGVCAGFLLALQLAACWRARRVLGRAAADTSSVDKSAAGERRRVYYFFAEHCGRCRAMAPLVAQLQPAHHHLIRVDVVQSLALARASGVAATPSFVLVKANTIRQVRPGGMSEKRLGRMREAI
ncbi:hypothetical protein TPL01_28740 [Sulfuriferula plumbiphila]|uniref:Thioredoxin domain-containing protein n=1 Tax=Sulfuriferula plumbiphila TaxID=171865 RepID=A0A512LBA1_9PROT|nr:thioredoxin family protein [Sulfuriferula plumbiphila]BBP04352.1 hypothetical protein SFPGR_17740 [Sulfuriferula plumbiphila]GEP31736.1 hypothetical protein TPL01_28740 [Sulfuriferula plumbiphila]